jgi:hypothetical protein
MPRRIAEWPMVALVQVFIRVSDTGSATFTRDQYPTSLGSVTLP